MIKNKHCVAAALSFFSAAIYVTTANWPMATKAVLFAFICLLLGWVCNENKGGTNGNRGLQIKMQIYMMTIVAVVVAAAAWLGGECL